MAGADESGQGLALRRQQGFLEGDALIARQHRLPDADEPVAAADGGRNVRHLVAVRLTLADRPAKLRKGFEEEGLDVVRLEPLGLGALHVLADAGDLAGVHRVLGQGTLLKQILNLLAVNRVGDSLSQLRPHLGTFAIANGGDEQIAQRLALKLELAQHIKDLAPQRLPRLLQLRQQRLVDITLAGLLGD